MSEIWVRGKGPLKGKVRIQGSKNAALPIMAAAVLHEGKTVLHNCPKIADVFQMEKILQSLGGKTEWKDHTLQLDCTKIREYRIPREEAETMRSSILFLGSVLARCGKIRISHPGGCTIGKRPIDLHLETMKRMGARIKETKEEIIGECTEGLSGTHIVFPISSVGATENALLAAVTAKGETLLENCAREPEIWHLCHFLQYLGAEIKGIGTDKIWIRRAGALRDAEYTIPSDRIVAGTCLYAAAATRGEITLENVNEKELDAVLSVYEKMGGQWESRSGTLRANAAGICCPLEKVATSPYPGFPTDMQSVLMTVLLTIPGISRIEEQIFENRFHVAKELMRMGGKIKTKGNQAVIYGGGKLRGSRVQAQELRGGAALVVAGLSAEGESIIEHAEYIQRGYEKMDQLFGQLGARIEIREQVEK